MFAVIQSLGVGQNGVLAQVGLFKDGADPTTDPVVVTLPLQVSSTDNQTTLTARLKAAAAPWEHAQATADKLAPLIGQQLPLS